MALSVDPFYLTVRRTICADPHILSGAVGKQLTELVIVRFVLYRRKMPAELTAAVLSLLP